MTCIFILACYNTCRKIVASNDHGCMRSKTITCERAVALHNSRAFLFWKSLFKANFWLNAILSTPFFNYLLVISITIIGIFKICFRIITLLILIVIGINSIWNFSAISKRIRCCRYLIIWILGIIIGISCNILLIFSVFSSSTCSFKLETASSKSLILSLIFSLQQPTEIDCPIAFANLELLFPVKQSIAYLTVS